MLTNIVKNIYGTKRAQNNTLSSADRFSTRRESPCRTSVPTAARVFPAPFVGLHGLCASDRSNMGIRRVTVVPRPGWLLIEISPSTS